ncbi:MAG TPA: hypothetical protein VHF47_01580 [Acidimicrobiales bacterium]|nr:hypothetical protein [Acidimicrobiales bacterium]
MATNASRSNQVRRAATIAAALLTALSLAVPASAGGTYDANRQVVRGGWVSPTCVFTDYNPVTGAFRCTSSTTWTGTWTGATVVEGEGTFDVMTGSGSGTIEETFVGRAADGTTGTLQFTEAWVADGPSLTIHIDGRIVAGTGDWIGATGRVSFDGTMASGSGFGGYVGSWTRPKH